MQGGLIGQGIELMFVGMGTVFVFLTLLVIATTLMSRIVLAWFPEGEDGEAEEELIAAATAAVQHHRGRRPQ